MDPEHEACYAQAQVELRELFHELECNGQVSAVALQRSLVPFTAGDVKRDLLELLAELQRKRQNLDEVEFLRVMWRKMYLSSVVDATKSAAAGQPNPINVSLAHVIVSVKRRRQLKQFASYYASRGISGADHLTSPPKSVVAGKGTSHKGSPLQSQADKRPFSLQHQPLQDEQTIQLPDNPGSPATNSAVESIVALRRRLSQCYDIVACVYESDRHEMRTRVILSRARSAEVRNCSRLYCLLFTKEAGNFVLGCTELGKNAQRNHQQEKDEYGIVSKPDSEFLIGSSLYRTVSWIDREEQGLLMVRMEELGLRNIVAAASNRASFAASTGRKMHQWRALEPYRLLCGENVLEAVGEQEKEYLDYERDKSDNNNKEEVAKVTASAEMLDADPTGDCFGLLGGKPLIARTKSIADVGDLRQLVAGEHFFMAVSSSGDLYSWESSPNTSSCSTSMESSLGRGSAIPERVPWFSLPEKVYRVACGNHHALVLTSSGVYAWGSNMYGQLGLGAHYSVVDPPILGPAPVCLPASGTPMLDVACGESHSVVLSAAGQVFTFGCNWEGQLGIDESRSSAQIAPVAATGCAYEPLLVHLADHPDEIKCVYLIAAGSQTTTVVATTGQVFQWGECVPDGINGVCGRVSRCQPEELTALCEDSTESVPGPVWHSIAIADGLVILTRHATLKN